MAGVTVFRQLSRRKGVSLILLILPKEATMPSASRMTTPVAVNGATIVEFSPTADLEATMAVVQENLTGSGAPA